MAPSPAPPGPTPSQTVGPFFSEALLREPHHLVADPPAVRIAGRLLDGDGEPVTDGVVELWQASPGGRFDDPAFVGWGRSGTDAEGRWWFHTVKPGPVPGSEGGGQAPHVTLLVLARGLLDHLLTRCYFDDEAGANATDPVLRLAGDRARTMVAARVDDPDEPELATYLLDLHLQGPDETAFLDPGG